MDANHCHVPAQLPKGECPRWDQFLAQRENSQIALVFASYYLRNPSSAFGHVFLTFLPDSASSSQTNILLQDVLNYGADFGNANFLEYYWKGVVGGFQGSFQIDRFHKKLREYGAMENRDIWVYPLRQSAEERKFLLALIWEKMQSKYDYYFFTQNCALQIAQLLDAAKPGYGLADLDRPYFIPAELIRRISRVPDFVAEPLYFPSIRSQFQEGISRLEPQWQDSVFAWSHQGSPAADAQSDPKAMKAAQTALLYLDWQHGLPVEREDPRWRERRTALWEYLARQSLSPAPHATSGEAPEKGLPESRISALVSVQDRQRAADYHLEHRFSLHSFLDRSISYDSDGMAEFLDASARMDGDNGSVTADRLTLLEIRTVAPYTRWSPSSVWSVFAGHRYFGSSAESPAEPVTELLVGKGFALALGEWGRIALQVELGALLREGWNGAWLWSGQGGPRLDFYVNTSRSSRFWIHGGRYWAIGEYDESQVVAQVDYVQDLSAKFAVRYGYSLGQGAVWPGKWAAGLMGYY